jgi:DNA-directed RNA polymerase specialized sigma24 family protein
MDVGGEIESDLNSPGRSAPLKTLLERLAIDSDVARAYEQLRLRLTTYFRLRFPAEAEALADEAIDRLARRLEDGTQVDNPASYALGIARFLVMETAARQRREGHAAREAMLELELQVADVEFDPALPALRTCLGCLDPESARLILEYYAVDGGTARIERRQQIAERLGMTLNALRNRALRTRMALEKCVRARLEDESARPGSDIPSKADTRNIMRYSRRDPTSDTHD